MPIADLIGDLLRDAIVGSRSPVPKYVFGVASIVLGVAILVSYVFIDPNRPDSTTPHNRHAAIVVGSMFVGAGLLLIVITRRTKTS